MALLTTSDLLPALSENKAKSAALTLLSEAGITQHRKVESSADLKDLLNDKDLDPGNLLECLRDIVHNTENETLKLKAIDMSLKLNGLMHSDNAAATPVVQIILKDFDGNVNAEVNPILIPRSFQES